MHYPEQNYYIRRVRIQKNSTLLPPLISAGYLVEDDVVDNSAVVVEFPVFSGESVRTLKDVSIWEQVALAAFIQKYWADNQVSITASFDPQIEAKDIEPILNYYQYQLKAVSFLPRIDAGSYAQMPYEAISREMYEERISRLLVPDFSNTQEEVEPERGCNNDTCLIPRAEI